MVRRGRPYSAVPCEQRLGVCNGAAAFRLSAALRHLAGVRKQPAAAAADCQLYLPPHTLHTRLFLYMYILPFSFCV